ncbi:MAG: DUF1343 domain-containing protein [Chloroflexi bacterium]|nr:DUF1343 domain-containing protein [Chloroflexota bacterium]
MAVVTGLDVLLNEKLSLLKQRRVGLVTNPAGVTAGLQSNIDALRDAGVNLVTLFAPEHGLAAAIGDAERVASERDPRTGLPVYSLYGDVRKPTREMFSNVDVLLYDLQDVGVRFYTYTATLALTLAACAEQGVPLIVLDRPIPINGTTVEGAMLDPALQSFIGHGPLPIRFGMTIGELAQFYNRELKIAAELQVIAMHGWRRRMWFDETGLTWVPTSPGIPHFATTLVYPGTCLVEGTNISEGRGTGLPFEIVGAPWLDGYGLAETLNARHIEGVRFRPTSFTPTGSKHASTVCHGVQVHVIDRNALQMVSMGLHIIAACCEQNPQLFTFLPSSWEGCWPHFDLLTGDSAVRAQLQSQQSVAAITAAWADGLEQFNQIRSRYLLYP